MKAIYQISQLPKSGVKTRQEGTLLRLLFDFNKVEKPVEKDMPVPADLYECESIDVHGSSYPDIVSAIVNDRYSADDAQAIMANYANALDPASELPAEKKDEYLAEYHAFQNWRARAKDVANIVIEGK